MSFSNPLIGVLALMLFALLASLIVITTAGSVREVLVRLNFISEDRERIKWNYPDRYLSELLSCFTPFRIARLLGLLFFRPRASMGLVILLFPVGFALLAAVAAVITIFAR
jgi:hypothetical protein